MIVFSSLICFFSAFYYTTQYVFHIYGYTWFMYIFIVCIYMYLYTPPLYTVFFPPQVKDTLS